MRKKLLLLLLMLSLALTGCNKAATDDTANLPPSQPADSSQAAADADAAATAAITLADLTAEQLELFKATAASFVDEVKGGNMTVEELTRDQNTLLEAYIMIKALPENGVPLFNEWKTAVAYYDKLAAWLKEREPEQQTTAQENPAPPADPAPAPAPAPTPAPPQDNTDTPDHSEAGIVPPGTVFTASGGAPPVKAEDAGNTFEDSLIRAVMATYDVSREEAIRMIENGEI